jgi:predicted membrane-bound spermidine synthase
MSLGTSRAVKNEGSENQTNTYLYVLVFFSGMTTLAVEITASRLLGNVFGTSNLVWANVIGLMLLYLTVGYFLGGWIADRSPKRVTIYRIVLIAAFLSSLIPFVSAPVLSAASQAVLGAQAALAIGSFISVLILFSVPITMLGMVSPFAIRLAIHSVEDSGRISGRIYGLSTLGSLLGTFVPVLLTIPIIGTTRTFVAFGMVLFSVALIGLFQEQGRRGAINLWMLGVIVIVAGLRSTTYTRAALSDNFEVLYQRESAYNYIQVQEDHNGFRYLFLNEGQGIHSQWHPTQLTYQRTWSFFLVGPYFNAPPVMPVDVENVLVIGLATGTIPRQHIAVYGDIPIDGVEIDPEIIQVGADFFGMNADEMPSLTTYAQDGRYVLNQLDTRYSVIAIDAYRPPYIPWHLTTVEFFEEVREHLQEDGVVVINVGRTATDRRLVDAMTATLQQVYPSVHALDVPATFNTILVATMQPTTPENLAANLEQLPENVSPILRDVVSLGVASQVPVTPSNLVFTDDRAPVELLVDSIVLNFVLSDELDQLR